jgi:YesN/AraC family two-component response regulator
LLLLVEDHAGVRYYLGRLLSNQYRIETASNGKEGFEKAIALIPDLIVSDVVMPKMDGYEMTSRLKADLRTSHIPIILLTAKSRHEEKLQGLEGGADAYMVKPFEEDELVLRIHKLIENRQKLRELFTRDFLPRTQREHTDPFIKKAVALLEDNFQNENFDIREFASEMHLSRMQVHRKLKALTGESASQFINRFRLEKGKELLLRKDLNISEVAYECGYGDPGYFSKLFIKSFGRSPQQFQQSQHI